MGSNTDHLDQSYIDVKGRLRWRGNDRLADLLKQLYDFLIIGDYEESHATRYPRLAHAISRHDESLVELKAEGRLEEFPGIGGKITKIVTELMETGTCSKMDYGDEFFIPPPRSVLEMTAVPRLGAKTARMLYQDHGIDSLKKLVAAAKSGSLEKVKGIGAKMIATILQHAESVR
ncbi:MAG: helix-hairpin-helix domain-containing protein [Planctomycetota bacterium]